MKFQTEIELVVVTIINGVIVSESKEMRSVDINILSVNAVTASDASVSYTKSLVGKTIGVGEKIFKYDLMSDLFSQAGLYLRTISSRDL